MTALARKISETPMAPYVDLLRNMKPQEMRIVVTFLQEAINEAESAESEETAADKRDFQEFCQLPFLTSEEFLLQVEF